MRERVWTERAKTKTENAYARVFYFCFIWSSLVSKSVNDFYGYFVFISNQYLTGLLIFTLYRNHRLIDRAGSHRLTATGTSTLAAVCWFPPARPGVAPS